ncbi:MAG: hypothetical protein DRP79_02410 [Planctomycetota bacterium]|nr:MAG: hypothetical protein DRP79_02410 [Planctomycetota bacterium]
MRRLTLVFCLTLFTIVLPSCEFEDVERAGYAAQALVRGFRPLTHDEVYQMSLGVGARIAGSRGVYDRDPALTKYVNMVAMTVGHYSDRPDFYYRVLLLDAPNEVNAFTTADGRIFMTTGLLMMIENESELAGILGHEIAHAARGHVKKAVENERRKIALITAASIMLEDYGVFAEIADSCFDIIALRPRSRRQESEADRYGTYYAEAAGYDPHGLMEFLKRVRDKQVNTSGSSFKALDTHPDINRRITDLEETIATNFRPRTWHPVMITTSSGRRVERSRYYTAGLRR